MMPDVTSTLRDLLAAHGVTTTMDAAGYLRTQGDYPACRATTSEPQFVAGVCQVRLDVEVALSAGRVLIESFSDVGSDADTAARQSWQNFCTGSLHVLLSALWRVVDPDQVWIDEFIRNGQTWQLHLGNLVRKAADGKEVPPPADLMPLFDQELQRAKLSQLPHWGRVFHGNMPDGTSILEVLLDNEPWAAGAAALRNASWPVQPFFYSTRLFWMMMPQNGAKS